MKLRQWPRGHQADRCGSCGRRPTDREPVLTCPGCGADSAIVASAIAARTLDDGPQSRPCETCEKVTIVTEPGMVCPDCAQLYPDVNDRLRERFAEFGPADPADAPCVGCGYYLTDPHPPSPYLAQLIDCQGCGNEISILLKHFTVGQGMHLSCADCGAHTVIPPTVWCPKCGRHLRRRGIPELVRDATRGELDGPRPKRRGRGRRRR